MDLLLEAALIGILHVLKAVYAADIRKALQQLDICLADLSLELSLCNGS